MPFAPQVIVPSPLEHEQLAWVAAVQPPPVRDGAPSPEPQPTIQTDAATLAVTQENFI
jgi:hypothetical protein